MPDLVHKLLATEAVLDKLGAGGITADDAGQLPRNPDVTVTNPRAPNPTTGVSRSGAPTAAAC